MSKLTLGQELREIHLARVDNSDSGFFRVGTQGVERIVIDIEAGQMSGVPWATVVFDDGNELHYNCALLEAVLLMPPNA